MQLTIANYRRAKRLLRTWGACTKRLIKLDAPE